MKKLLLLFAACAAFLLSVSPAADAYEPFRWRKNFGATAPRPAPAPMHVYVWPNGASGFSSPTITYGATPATVYSPWLYSPYNYGPRYGYGGGFGMY